MPLKAHSCHHGTDRYKRLFQQTFLILQEIAGELEAALSAPSLNAVPAESSNANVLALQLFPSFQLQMCLSRCWLMLSQCTSSQGKCLMPAQNARAVEGWWTAYLAETHPDVRTSQPVPGVSFCGRPGLLVKAAQCVHAQCVH